MIGQLLNLSTRAGQGPRRGAAGLVRPRRRRREDGQDLLRRDASAPRPGRGSGRPSGGDLPGRADHRTRPGQARGHVGRHPQPRHRGIDRAADHAVPRRGRCPGRRDQRDRPRAGDRPRHPGGPEAGGRWPADRGPPDRCDPARRRREHPGRDRLRRAEPSGRNQLSVAVPARRPCPGRSSGWVRRESASPSSPCTCPASTRSSSPSPVAARATTRPAPARWAPSARKVRQHERHPHPRIHDRPAPAPAGPTGGAGGPRRGQHPRLSPARPGDRQAQPDQDLADARGADRRHRPAGDLPGDVHLHLRRRHRPGRLPAAVPAVPAPRHPRSDHRHGRHRPRHQPEHRHREGHLRPVPVAADRPLGPAGRGRGRRRRALPHAVRGHHGCRLPDGVPGADRTDAGARGHGTVHRVRALLLLDLGVRRDGRADLRLGAGASAS